MGRLKWREYFGIDPALDDEHPGHTLGCLLFYAMLLVCLVLLSYAVRP